MIKFLLKLLQKKDCHHIFSLYTRIQNCNSFDQKTDEASEKSKQSFKYWKTKRRYGRPIIHIVSSDYVDDVSNRRQTNLIKSFRFANRIDTSGRACICLFDILPNLVPAPLLFAIRTVCIQIIFLFHHILYG